MKIDEIEMKLGKVIDACFLITQDIDRINHNLNTSINEIKDEIKEIRRIYKKTAQSND